MKNHLVITALILSFSNFAGAQQNQSPAALTQLVNKLNTLQNISYYYHNEVNNIKDNYHAEIAGNVYLEFEQADKRSVARFQLGTNNYQSIYNGTELFSLDKKPKTYSLTVQPKQQSFGNNSFFHNAIPTMRSMLQQLAESDTIPKRQSDTLIANKAYKVVTLSLHRSSLQYLGSTMHFTKDVTIYYHIIIDPATWLPYQVIEDNNIDKDGYYTKTTFTNINISPKAPATDSWYYSTYQNEYQPEKKEKLTPMIAAGSLLLDWELPELSARANTTLQSADVKGKIVLMDFWIKNCGPCMESFPYLQALQQKYGANKFQLLAINAYDKKEDVNFFYKREKPVYKMLYAGEKMAKNLGVSFYPSVILLDKNGKVLYSGGMDHAKVEELIKENM
jgi:thiol-disulfide isomerase/thioredoxin/outer membrane lipoprotein-sorting protein